jgi:hypothetical protein
MRFVDSRASKKIPAALPLAAGPASASAAASASSAVVVSPSNNGVGLSGLNNFTPSFPAGSAPSEEVQAFGDVNERPKFKGCMSRSHVLAFSFRLSDSPLRWPLH